MTNKERRTDEKNFYVPGLYEGNSLELFWKQTPHSSAWQTPVLW